MYRNHARIGLGYADAKWELLVGRLKVVKQG